MLPGNHDTPGRITDAVRRLIVSEQLIAQGDLVLSAVSGGADSMTLLSVLHRLTPELGFSLAAAHLDHRIRESAASELDRVRIAAASMGIPFHSGAENVPAEAERTGDSLEEAARKARYRFLHAKAKEIGAARIATGHTMSDHVETVLMRIVRGTGLRGLAGIPARRGIVVRPLLGLAREDTVSYCAAAGLTFVDDASNRDTRFFRNRVRLELLPMIESRCHPGVRENLARLADIARSALEKIRLETRPLLEEDFRRAAGDRWELATARLSRFGELELAVLFGDIFAEKIECDMDFTRVHYEELARLALDPATSGKMLSLPGMAARREHGKIVFARSIEGFPRIGDAGWSVKIAVPGVTGAPGATVSASILAPSELDLSALRSACVAESPADTPAANARRDGAESAAANSAASAAPVIHEAFFDLESIAPPLVVRSPEPGDRMRPFGMRGSKKLSDIFIDKKIPAGERPTSLVIADTDDILWLVGVATGEKCRIRSETREIVNIRVNISGKDPWSG
jgi:tRNA(Ile)-lysidine synthase